MIQSLPRYRKRRLLGRIVRRAMELRRAEQLGDAELMAVVQGTAEVLDEEKLPPLKTWDQLLESLEGEA